MSLNTSVAIIKIPNELYTRKLITPGNRLLLHLKEADLPVI